MQSVPTACGKGVSLGATRMQTALTVVVPAAFSASRRRYPCGEPAVGET